MNPAFIQELRSPVLRELAGAIVGVGAGQTAIVKIPPGSTYGSVSIQASIAGVQATRAQVIAMLTQWRLTVSGVEVWTLTGAQLIAIIEFYRSGLIGDSGYITIPFERLFMDGLAAQLGPQFGTLGETSFQLEITQAGGSTVDSLRLWAEIPPVAEPLGSYIKTVRLTPNFASTGVFIYNDLPLERTLGLGPAYLYALHFEVPVVANLTRVAYMGDNMRIVDAPFAYLNRRYLNSNPNRTVQTAGLFCHLDFTARGIDNEAIRLNMDSQILELTFANAAPNNFTILAEIGLSVNPTQGQTVSK